MKIINPIYDQGFKYLLQDLPSARLIIQAILGLKIKKIKQLNQEYYKNAKEKPKKDKESMANILGGFRLDFVCYIETGTGEEQVLIVEIQRKTKESDIDRFRTYLAAQYQSDFRGKEDKVVQICSIYFLEHGDPALQAYPAVHVQRKYVDMATNDEIIEVKSNFVEKLSHEVIIINLKAIETYCRTELEQVLQIFNQKNMKTRTVLEIDEATYPKSYTQLLQRLNLENVRDHIRMLLEAEAKAERDFENQLAQRDKIIAEKDNAIIEKDNVIIEKDNAIIEKDNAIIEKDNALIEKDNALIEKEIQLTHSKAAIEKERKEKREAKKAEAEAKKAKKEAEKAIIKERKQTHINAIQIGLKYGASPKEIAKDLKISLRSVQTLIKELKGGSE